MSEIKQESVVQLKSGGPLMTVTKVENGFAELVWYEEGQIKRFSVEVSALKLYEEEQDDILVSEF